MPSSATAGRPADRACVIPSSTVGGVAVCGRGRGTNRPYRTIRQSRSARERSQSVLGRETYRLLPDLPCYGRHELALCPLTLFVGRRTTVPVLMGSPAVPAGQASEVLRHRQAICGTGRPFAAPAGHLRHRQASRLRLVRTSRPAMTSRGACRPSGRRERVGTGRAAPPHAARARDQELSVISAAIFGVPMPVASSYPGVAGYRPLVVTVCPAPVMSLKYLPGSVLNSS
jgi:hypothetical protein